MKEETRVKKTEDILKRRISLITTLQDMLSQANRAKDSDLVAIIKKQIYRAKLGDLDSAKFLFDRAFGTPVQTIETHNETDLNINININEKQRRIG